MQERAIDKRLDELSRWDLDAGCRHIVDQTTPANRRLKRKLRKQARKRINTYVTKNFVDTDAQPNQE